MADLVEHANLAVLLQEAGVAYRPGENFEAIYEALRSKKSSAGVARALEDRLREYFASILIPTTATIYDRLILSLREKDYLASFNWDPLLSQAYRRNLHLRALPSLLFLHGNVDIGVCLEHKRPGFLGQACPHCRRPLEPVPLLYPIGTKNYEDDLFIRDQWNGLRAALQDAYLLTIFGYAAPTSDAAAKALMLESWQANQTRELAEIDIVDVRPRADLEGTWAQFFVRNHYGVSSSPVWLFKHPRRTCDHFAMATLQQQPCPDNPLPQTEDLAELQAWVAPLIEQERALRDRGVPFPC